MHEFIKAISGTVLGAAIALSGTVYTTTKMAEKERKADLRNRLEMLISGAVRSDRCYQIFVLNKEEPKDCEEQEPLWKAITLSELYFYELKPEMIEFHRTLLEGKAELHGCRPLINRKEKDGKLDWDECALRAYETYDTSSRLAAIFEKAKPIMERLR